MSGLAPGSKFVAYFATETAGSRGVLGALRSAAVATHAAAPALLEAAALAVEGVTDALALRYRLESPGLLHYVVLDAAAARSADRPSVPRGPRRPSRDAGGPRHERSV